MRFLLPSMYRAVPVRLPGLGGCQCCLRVQTDLFPFDKAGRERVEDGAGGGFRLLHPFRNIDMKSDERSPDIGTWTGWTISSDPDHGKICSWLIRQIRAEFKPCPLIQMEWFFPRYVQGRAAIQFVGVYALAHAVGRKPEWILAMLGKRYEENGQGYHFELTPGAMQIQITSQIGNA